MAYPTKDVVNTLYHSAIITGLAVAYSVIGKKLIELDVGDPAKLGITDFIKLTVVITLSVASKDWLVAHKIIPDDIINSK